MSMHCMGTMHHIDRDIARDTDVERDWRARDALQMHLPARERVHVHVHAYVHVANGR